MTHKEAVEPLVVIEQGYFILLRQGQKRCTLEFPSSSFSFSAGGFNCSG